MAASAKTEIQQFMVGLEKRNPGEPEFQQAVQEVAETLMPFILDHKEYKEACILERMTEPDRVVIFRVCWEDDKGNIRTNRAWRVQFNNSIGPYKGGMRFHPTVTLSVLKFLGFEQVFKNALTGLPMGGGKGGSNFNPKGKSSREVMRFCQSLMIELHRHIGEDTDVPAGDIGVGAREISYLFGQYKRLENRFVGVLTGKGLAFGGSLIRTEATGYGAVFFVKNMLEKQGDGIEGKTAVVSGSGNVATYCIEKLAALGATVVTASDSGGFIHDPDGIEGEKLEWLKELKEVRRGRISEYAEHFGVEYHEGQRPWSVPCDLAFPCATQNELDGDDARELIANGVKVVAEGANMPSTLDAIHSFLAAKILFAPAKAANAGGVGVSGLEQSQNSLRIAWSREEVEDRLKGIMQRIHEQCVNYGTEEDGFVNYVKGANIAGFVKVADAMVAYGTV
ncbi:MAG: NADP-specific glutamate dehydrogenase [Planctomycetaceae bacterium]|jgi:glutamate dehydrogenase (NADP+)|nr:NADP-specific glutamate dehydrogenase [Planctomycetaceae bacterium]MBT6157044.1 NADP-specific glutamate dehydrogenase [Planctomycetaceae bacterium]MBT6484390.1 NADP-specific glutamate dehydrogenase [Planctomycetaceae bacterium]MBT6498009.1 NADP-specific glutamate dehydrogenase [Planctomycetaceae bacterium]